ncbi:DNA recombination protein RmuC [Nocardioides nematodiphilus]|uniref:DNA recombination protein RmuC n=1 Tax=Nocardioides nematodiphilus TaxID=2849669 RepID=UPI001CDA2190|nr:DNA recombination protein RmuC [Nocardioides nematodiphilus]MCA1982915.1 DNA recombination protein RmuC [Nocardioides nematodiphilus]
MEIFALFVALVVGLALGALIGVFWIRSRPAALEGALDQAEVMQSLDRLSDQMHHLDRERAQWQGRFHAQVDQLQKETRTLSTALRRPQVRGRWGELHLRRAVELAGLVDRCDFTEQVRIEDGAMRPDLVVHLAGGRRIVVDAKVPLDAHLDATSTEDEAERIHHFNRHAHQLRTHIDQLGSKAYWRSLPDSPEFVVLFVPAESFLAAALETDGALIEYAAARQVVLATPTTLIALLRTVAHGWSQETLADEARQIHQLGRDLHHRLATFSGHLDAVGRSLNATVTRYNQAIGSLEGRVMVSARRFGELGVTEEPLPSPRPVELHAVRRAAADDADTDPNVAM